MTTTQDCPKCGSTHVSVAVRGSMGGVDKRHITCHSCCMVTAIPADPREMVFGKYSEKDLIEMLVAIGLLAEYPETMQYVGSLQKDLEAAIDRLGD